MFTSLAIPGEYHPVLDEPRSKQHLSGVNSFKSTHPHPTASVPCAPADSGAEHTDWSIALRLDAACNSHKQRANACD